MLDRIRAGAAMRTAAVPLLLLLPLAASAHEVLLQVERGRGVAARAIETDGDPLAGAEYQVWSPADPGSPWTVGRTDRNGWLAFVPDAAGRWRVKVFEPGGHGLDTPVDVSGPLAGARTDGPPSPGTVGFVLRPLAAVAVIALVFGGLLALRRKGRAS